MSFWALLGIGMLLKQSVLLFAMAPILYCIVRRRQLRWQRSLTVQQLAGLAIFLAIISPMLLWEWRHEWPMLGHTLGHLGLGADHATRANHGNPLTWVGGAIGGLVGAGGPAFLALSAWSSWRAIQPRDVEPDRWPARLWMLCAAWPGVLFFIALSFFKPIVASWPLPSLVPLVPLVGEMAAIETSRSRSAAPSAFSRWWGLLVAYGIGGAVLIMFPTILALLPFGAGAKVDRVLLSRLRGSRAEAALIDAAARSVPAPDGRLPIIVTPHYMKASLLRFYLANADDLTITTSCGYVGARPNNFDVWDDTRLSNPAFHGRSLLLVGGDAEQWRQLLRVDSIQPLESRPDLLLASNFQGRRLEVRP